MSADLSPESAVATPLLEVRDLSREFSVRQGLLGAVQGTVRAVTDVSLAVWRGETLGLVGESGCGKSTLGRMLVGLLPPSSGDILLNGHSLVHPDPQVAAGLPGRLQMVFQDPFSSLNPRLPVGVSVAEPLRARGVSAAERREKTQAMLELVGLDPTYGRRFPHEFSGGQRQRIAIARALITHPDVVVCDEAVSALDASVQAQVLNVLNELRDRFDLTYVFISHDLGVVGHMSDRVAVMYLGQVVELASRESLFARPAHPYSVALLAAAPRRGLPRKTLASSESADITPHTPSILLDGELPSPLDPPCGCVFHPRCPNGMDICSQCVPPLVTLAAGTANTHGHTVRCHLYAAAGEAVSAAF